MCRAAGVADDALVRDLRLGFALAGKVPAIPGGRPVDAVGASYSLQELWHATAEASRATLDRVARDRFVDGDVEQAFLDKVREDVAVSACDLGARWAVACAQAGRARWIRLPDDKLITPRFIVDGGWKEKSDGSWKRKVRWPLCAPSLRRGAVAVQIRCVDDFSASGVNSATATEGRVRHDGLDAMVASLQRQARCFVAWSHYSPMRYCRRRAAACQSPSSRRILWARSTRCQSDCRTSEGLSPLHELVAQARGCQVDGCRHLGRRSCRRVGAAVPGLSIRSCGLGVGVGKARPRLAAHPGQTIWAVHPKIRR